MEEFLRIFDFCSTPHGLVRLQDHRESIRYLSECGWCFNRIIFEGSTGLIGSSPINENVPIVEAAGRTDFDFKPDSLAES